MKFFMFGENMLLREEAGDGTDGEAAAGADTGDSTNNKTEGDSNEKETSNEEKETNEEEVSDKAEGDKAEGDKAEGDKAEGDKAEGDKAEGAPESYEEFIIPEGYDGIIDKQSVEEFSAIAKNMNLSQESAQELVNYEIKRQEQMFDAYTEQTEKWVEDVKTDKEIGGADHELKMAVVAKSFKALATDEFSTLMNPYHPVDNPKGLGLGNHPEVVRLFYRIGLKMSEDGLALANVGGETKLSRETVMYGNKK